MRHQGEVVEVKGMTPMCLTFILVYVAVVLIVAAVCGFNDDC